MKKEFFKALLLGFTLSVLISLSNWRLNRQVIEELDTAATVQVHTKAMISSMQERLRKITANKEQNDTTGDTTTGNGAEKKHYLSNADKLLLFDMMRGIEELQQSAVSNVNIAIGELKYMFTYRPMLVIAIVCPLMTLFFLKLAEHKNHAQEMEKSANLLRTQNDKLESVMRQRERFIATLAHDMKVPLVGADRVFGLMIEEKVVTSTLQQSDLLKKLRKNNSEVLTKLQDMIEIYRYENTQLARPHAPANMSELLKRCADRIAPFASLQGVSILADLDCGDRRCDVDALGIERLVLSLLDNAVKFSGKQSVVTLSAMSTDNELQIKVVDNGTGISPEDQSKMFNGIWMSEQTGSRTSGNGLGLYLAKLVAEAHGGTIDCVSEVGVGSTFTVHLPLSKNSAVT